MQTLEREVLDHHRLGLVAQWLKLVNGVVAGWRGEHGRDALHDGGAGSDVVHQAEERQDRDAGGASVEDGVRVVRELHAELDGKPREVSRVHADDSGVRVDGDHKLRAMLVQVANGILRHLSATILYDPDWPATHSKPTRTFRLPGAGGLTRLCAWACYTALTCGYVGPLFTISAPVHRLAGARPRL